MGWRFEIHVWQRRPGRRNGANGEYGWEPVWSGNIRPRLILALIPALAARQGRPLRVVYR